MHLVAVTPRLSATPGRIRHTGPSLGQHNAEVFAEFGIDPVDASSVATEALA
jgi:crotonobetainyl-CoA:carnitine CoA-transferase CaiB-like acyl-CoA transferase